MPFTRDDGVEQPTRVETANATNSPHARGVADAAIERVGSIFGEADDVRRGLAARQLAKETGDACPDQNDAEPRQQARVESALEQIECERAGRDEEDENPDRPVIDAVIMTCCGRESSARCRARSVPRAVSTARVRGKAWSRPWHCMARPAGSAGSGAGTVQHARQMDESESHVAAFVRMRRGELRLAVLTPTVSVANREWRLKPTRRGFFPVACNSNCGTLGLAAREGITKVEGPRPRRL